MSHPETRRPSGTRFEGDDYVNRLVPKRVLPPSTSAKIRYLGSRMLIGGSSWEARQTKRRNGRPLSESTLYQHRHNYETFMASTFGSASPDTVGGPDIEELTFVTILKEFKDRGAPRSLGSR